jgi:acetyl esterase/lipase
MKIFTEYLSDDKQVTLTCYVQEPSREMKTTAEKPAVLVIPGGAYLFTSDREAEPIALAYASRGFQAFVLWYSTGKRAAGCKPLNEASKAIGLIRQNAEKWHVVPDKIVTCGFSAGGHLSAWVGLCGENKPNGMIICYGATEIFSPEQEREHAEKGEKNPLISSLLGSNYSEEEAEALNLSNHVNKDSIPMFSWGTVEDVLVKAPGILKFTQAYAEAERPFELHLFQYGEHGLALSNYVTANGRKSMVEPAVEGWLDMSVNWFHRNFGEPVIVDKPYEMIPGLIPED